MSNKSNGDCWEEVQKSIQEQMESTGVGDLPVAPEERHKASVQSSRTDSWLPGPENRLHECKCPSYLRLKKAVGTYQSGVEILHRELSGLSSKIDLSQLKRAVNQIVSAFLEDTRSAEIYKDTGIEITRAQMIFQEHHEQDVECKILLLQTGLMFYLAQHEIAKTLELINILLDLPKVAVVDWVRAKLVSLRANCWLSQGNYKLCVKDLTKAIEMDVDDDISLYYCRGQAYVTMRAERYLKKAHQDYTHFVEHCHPHHRSLHSAYFSLSMLEAALNDGDVTKGNECYQKALKAAAQYQYFYGKEESPAGQEIQARAFYGTGEASDLLQMNAAISQTLSKQFGFPGTEFQKSKGVCKMCGKSKNLKVCSRCKAVRYCGAKCQKRDWKKHKVGCKKLKEAADATKK